LGGIHRTELLMGLRQFPTGQRKGPAREPEFQGGPMNFPAHGQCYPITGAGQFTKSSNLLGDNYPVP
jgi:hypothetical protein